MTFHTYNVTNNKNKNKNKLSFDTYFYINLYSNILSAVIDFLFIILICTNLKYGQKCMAFSYCLFNNASDDGCCMKCLMSFVLNNPLLLQFLITLLSFSIIIAIFSKQLIILLILHIIAIILTIVYWYLSKFMFNKKLIPPSNKPNIETNPKDISTTQVKVNQPESGKTILN